MAAEGLINLTTEFEETDWSGVYPRPQLVRDSFFSLNGKWELNGQSIIVPYPPEAALSHFEGKVTEELRYVKHFVLPEGFIPAAGDKPGHAAYHVILHFGAVDQIAVVELNGHKLGKHIGGYLPFSYDVTDYLVNGDNTLSVYAVDRLDHTYPWGKQKTDRGGMWYTPVSGIWQSVWMEAVPAEHISQLKITPHSDDTVTIVVDADNAELQIFPPVLGSELETFVADALATYNFSRVIKVNLSDLPGGVRHWDTEEPYLYPIEIKVGEDIVKSYFGHRIISFAEIDGIKRVTLNGRPVFLHGLLDQGYFPDGIFLPGNPEGYKFDIEKMKELGFNLLRKHIKVEPETYYYEADKAGMLVMQDMVNSGEYHYLYDTIMPTVQPNLRINDKILHRDPATRKFFIDHSNEILDHLYDHPCVVAYTVFNEGWGQFCSDAVGNELKNHDPSRIYDYTSGWFAQKDSDFDSIHRYFNFKPPKVKNKPVFISECGGYSYKVDGHIFNTQNEYGYGGCKDAADLTDRIIGMYEKMVLPAIENGLVGSIYTQVSDVEDEVNGIYTYDRKVCKVDSRRIKKLSDRIMKEI